MLGVDVVLNFAQDSGTSNIIFYTFSSPYFNRNLSEFSDNLVNVYITLNLAISYGIFTDTNS